MSNAAMSRLVGSRKAKLLPDAIGDILHLSLEDLRTRGLTDKQAETVRAAVDFGFQVSCPTFEYERIRICTPSTAIRYCLERFTELRLWRKQEEFWIVTLDTKNQPIQHHQITVGTLRNSLVHPREVFRPAIVDSANSILVLHNHPSGDPTPSDQDIAVTDRLESAAEIIGIPLMDHIVLGGERGISINDWKAGNRW